MSDPLTTRPLPADLPAYYHGYVQRLPAVVHVLDALEAGAESLAHLLTGLTREREVHRYGPGKWSVREVLGHLVDTERVFQLRALWFARGDAQALPGYDENRWGETTNAGELPLARLVPEYRAVRRSTVLLFRNMGDAELARVGEANGQAFRTGALPWFILGHERHHREILHSRYGL